MITHFEDAGFTVEVVSRASWPAPPLDPTKFDRAFAALSQHDILTKGVMVRLGKNGGQ